MKKFLIIPLLCTTFSAFSQSFQVGDSVTIKSDAKHWMTGEPISAWVYLSPHPISQVGSSFHPDGLLINVSGARSWIKKDEVIKHRTNAPEVQTDTIILHDTIISVQKEERLVYVHDTIYVPNEAIKEPATQEKKPQTEPILYPDEFHRFQFYGDFNQYFNHKLYGAALALTFGARLTEYAFVGGGVEFGYWMAGQNAAKSMEFPVFVNTKIYLPVSQKFYPYIDMSLGANMGYRTSSPDESLRSTGFHYGAYAKGGIGIDMLKCLSLGVGYQYSGGFSNVSNDLHHAYVKIGFYFLR